MPKSLEGTIVAYEISDGIGRIELDDGEELRFSIRALRGMVPAVGVRVEVGSTEPHPLGGLRALDVTLADDKASYEKRRKQFEKAQGEIMRRDLGRRADEIQMPVAAIKKALTAPPAFGDPPPPAPPPRASSVPALATPPAARGRAHTTRRAVPPKVEKTPPPRPAPRPPAPPARTVATRPMPAVKPAPPPKPPGTRTTSRNVVSRPTTKKR
ncbi:MAG TPA: hypothetical protein VMZ28_26700 [Kofleriaceae bacterium]|nr:hypothetical protein [Kofleriaceae bacterium]